jgi:hypothetical protein
MGRLGAPRREGLLVLALAALAALRIAVFSLAFPFFGNVDEYRHLDVVLKYSHGYWPRPGPDPYEVELAWWIGLYGSPEYHRDPSNPKAPAMPRPSWELPAEAAGERVAQQVAYLSPRHSLEADQPPLYYACAGAWLALGRALGIDGGWLLYWVRLLGAAVGGGCVLVTWLLLRGIYPESPVVRVGAPLLLAFLPLDSLYTVTSDVFSPLLGGLTFLLVVRLVRTPAPRAVAFVAAGLCGAAGFLTKYPNAALGAASLFCTGVALSAQPTRARLARRWLLFWLAFLLPPMLWLGRNLVLGGDLTGTGFKVEKLGWVRKPFYAWGDHPLFSPAGLATFVRHLVPTFWRGELVWGTRTLAWPLADWTYLLTTLLFVSLAALGLGRASRAWAARVTEASALCAVLAGVAVLAWLSLLFHFPERANPSASFPYFVEGRLISGVLVPFALLYVRGIEVATSRLSEFWRAPAAWGLLAAVLALALGSELALTRPVFLSAFNAYHLP